MMSFVISCSAKNNNAFCLEYKTIIFYEEEIENFTRLKQENLVGNELKFRDICN